MVSGVIGLWLADFSKKKSNVEGYVMGLTVEVRINIGNKIILAVFSNHSCVWMN